MTGLLAMHMANELLSVPVAAVTCVVAACAVGVAARAARKQLDNSRLALLGVMGAFIFAAQMINFPVLPGTSGHLGGGVLLAILLGPAASIVVMTAILIVQCLLFQDGGLLALGCNIINMGVVPSLVGWALYRGILGRGKASAGRQYVAAWAAAMLGVVGGASLVPLEAAASGVLAIPVGQFFAVMVGVHVLIGFVEGAITFAVIRYVRRTSPELLDEAAETKPAQAKLTLRPVIATGIISALLLAGVVSWFASANPDGLEKCLAAFHAEKTASVSPAAAGADELQSRFALMPDYNKRATPLGNAERPAQEEAAAHWPNVSGWGTLAGVLGTLVTLGILYGVKALLRRPAAAGQE